MSYTIRHIAGVMGGEWLCFHRDDVVGHLLLDSRRLVFPGSSLFIALRGPRRDGAAYLEELYKRGVRNFVVGAAAAGGLGVEVEGQEVEGREVEGREVEGSGVMQKAPGAMPEANIIVVADTLEALQRLAAWHRAQFAIPVIAITGSNGKTIVKEWLNELLEPDFTIVRSPKSYNSQIGVPLSVWELDAGDQLAIFEAGISRPGEMERLEAVIKPTIGIFTNIGEAHSEGFPGRAAKAAEKLKLFGGVEALIFCGDQEETTGAIKKWKEDLEKAGRDGPVLLSWGREVGNSIWAHQPGVPEGATRVEIKFGPTAGELILPFTDQASVENAMHCVAACLWLKIAVEDIISRVARLAPIAMRLELKSGINHCSIINDSYSADLSSLGIALDFLSQQRQHDKRSVILSDIPESGRAEEELYAEVGRALQQRQVDRLIGIGARISANAARIGEWFSGEQVYFPTVGVFREEIHRLHFRDETILIKGARIYEFETIDRLLTEQIHQTVMEIDLGAMAGNLLAYRQLLGPTTRVMAMVKAFAYGSGSFEIANLLQFHGVDYLGVAYADEGVALRKGGIRMPIMVMNTENSGFDLLAQYNLEPVLYSLPLLYSFERWLKKEGLGAFPVHLELETGMNRLGFAAQDWEELLRVLPAVPVKVMSVFSHFAASEEADQDAYSKRQAAAYRARAGQLEKVLGYSFIRHLANSAATVRMPEWQLDMVRLGIGLYGVDSAASFGAASRLDLREVSTLKTTIAQIKHLREGDTIGYSRRGLAGVGTVIATVRIGYADGYARNLGNGVGKMWVKGVLAPTIGSVSMDLTMIDITGIPDVGEGDEVVVFGKELPVSRLARWAGTIPYEILTGVSQRVKRIYFE